MADFLQTLNSEKWKEKLSDKYQISFLLLRLDILHVHNANCGARKENGSKEKK